jgi:hypothetical protein
MHLCRSCRIKRIEETGSMSTQTKTRWRAFWDWFVLFSGISTASNLSRTRPDPVRRRGLFLFRSHRPK